VLIVYAMALLEKSGEPLSAGYGKLAPAGIAVASALTALVVVALLKSSIGSSPPAAISARAIGQVLLNQLLVPFEALSLLLLAALIGALLVAKGEKGGGN